MELQLKGEQYAKSLIEANLNLVIIIDTENNITDMNEVFVKIVAQPREKLLNTAFENYFTDKNRATKICAEIFKNGAVNDIELTITDHISKDILFNGFVYRNKEQNVVGAIIVARDIAKQKSAEKELIAAKNLAEQAQIEAEKATKIAEEAVKSKQQFLSNMSHEIRTPMNAIIGFTRVILKTELTAKQKEYLSAIKVSGDALIVLINDILDLAKVDAGKMLFEKISFKLALSVNAMLHLFEAKIQEKNLTLQINYDDNIPTVLLGDAVRLHQIILNLVSNAVKFTNNGGIIVDVKKLGEDEEKVTIEFSISDTGIGIAKDKLNRIFENFQQATIGTSRLYGGTGLGLAIVKELVELQGGNIAVNSNLNEGSTFSFILNFDKTDINEVLEQEILELDTDVKDIKILVVEDMVLNQLLMKTLLDDFGFESDITANGKLAIEKLASKKYNIILMDLQMPEMNGFETTDYIRNTLKYSIPIIALTADVTTVDVAKCKAVGMNDYIAKPVDERLLYSKIIGLVKKPIAIVTKELLIEAIEDKQKISCIDLSYLNQRTKSNSTLMLEMISIYLEQTPTLITDMKKSYEEKNWINLDATIHKMIPSFSIMGLDKDYEAMAKKIQLYANAKNEESGIGNIVEVLENILQQSCKELEIEFNRIKNNPQ